MKITFVTNGLTSGGSERVLSLVANELCRRGHDVEILSYMDTVVFYELEPRIKVLFADREANSHSMMKKIIWIRKYVKKTKPNVVIAFLQRVYCLTIMSLLGTGIPVISSERNDPRYYNKFYKLLMHVFLPFTSHHIVQTQSIKEYFPKRIQQKTTIIPNPVNEDIYNINCEGIEKKNLIVNVGRMTNQKNQMMLIDAFNKILPQFPDYQLVIYGDGPMREKLEEHISELSLKDKVLLPGRCETIFERMGEAKLFCLSSNFEGMSNALIEAICLGLPIVTTDVSGVKELIQDGQNGYVVNKGDVDGYASAMRRLLLDEKQMSLFAESNKNRANDFRIKSIINRWESVIESVS